MSLLNALQKKKATLRPTDTKVRHIDGSQFIEKSSGQVELTEASQYGFVVDTKPDKIPSEIIKNELYLGSQDCVDLEILSEHGIESVLSVGVDTPIMLPPQFTHKFINCLDLPEVDFSPILDEAIVFIKSCIVENLRVLVHCNAGVSRSSTIVLGYLIRECGIPFDQAYRIVKYKRPAVQPNAGFMNFLKLLP